MTGNNTVTSGMGQQVAVDTMKVAAEIREARGGGLALVKAQPLGCIRCCGSHASLGMEVEV